MKELCLECCKENEMLLKEEIQITVFKEEKVKEVRERLHYTKEELAFALGVKTDIIWRYEKGVIPIKEHEKKYRRILKLDLKEKKEIEPLELKKWLLKE